jgi:tRNA threonylcarbamoyl adenosine modification protein YjeE
MASDLPLIVSRDLPAPGATGAMARAVGALLRAGDVLLLSGPMGAGKTTFTRELARALGADAGLVSSPTYVMINRYPLRADAEGAPNPRGPLLTHVDAYRLTSDDDLDVLGWDRVIDGASGRAAEGVVVIEWPERIAPALGGVEAARLTLSPTGATSRGATLELPASWRGRPEAALLAEREPTRCRTTGRWVAPTDPAYPFADERARMADLNRWFTESYSVSRRVEEEDLDSED